MSLRPPAVPSVVVGHVHHDRRTPLRHRFRNRHHAWLVELPEDGTEPVTVPGTGAVARVLRRALRLRAADHLDGGRLGGGLHGDLTRWLGRRGVQVRPGDRALMLAQPRVAGYVFNPLSVYWVLRPEGDGRCAPVAVVAEVHNTYGERHAYLLHPDERGVSHHGKEFYVSPFNDVSGDYRIRTALTPERVVVTITLRADGSTDPFFAASTTGVPRPATPRTVRYVLARQPGASYRTFVLIRAHGVWLWLRRLPVRPRPVHSQEAVR